MSAGQVTDGGVSKKIGGARKKSFAGFVIDKLDRRPIAAVMAALGLKVDEEASTEQLGIDLCSHFSELKAKGSKLIKCDNCEGESPADIKGECPFCGSKDEVVNTEAGEMKTKQDVVEEKPKKGPKAEKGAQKADALAKANGKSHDAIPITEKDLDENVSAFRQLDALLTQASGAVEAINWKRGQLLQKNYDDELWRTRIAPDGKRMYSKMGDFTMKELNITGRHAMDLMTAAANFDEKTVTRIGIAKAILLSRAPDNARERLLSNVVDKGASVKEVAIAVKAATEGKNFGGTGRQGKVGGGAHQDAGKKLSEEGRAGREAGRQKAVEASAKKRAADKASKAGTIVIATLVGKKTVAFKKSKDVPKVTRAVLAEIDKLPAAKQLADEPIAFEEMTNDVTRTYFLTRRPDGGLVLRIETRREEA